MAAPESATPLNIGRDDDMVVFGKYQLFPNLGLLMKDGVRLELGERAMSVLIHLVSMAGQVVSKDQLLEKVWPQEVVEENNLQAQISSLRKVLGADRNLIGTLFGRGYCFTATVNTRPAVTSTVSIRPTLTGLPRPRSPLIGREKELCEVRKRLLTHPLCTITGPAGIGKTRLLLEVARESAGVFPDGVFFADLSYLSSAADPLETLNAALAGIGSTLMAERAHQQPALLVVDNCEHLADACARAVEQLLQADSLLSVVLTSQSPLGVEGEQVYRLGPLAVPAVEVDVIQAKNYSAIEFIVQKIQAVDYQFRLSEDNVKHVAALCRLLDAVPLALEIAAARITGLGIEAVLEDLTTRAGMLETARRGAPSRHRTLGDALDWSYQLLSPSEKQVFQELAIFAGEFDIHAAEQVLSPVADQRIIDIIASLVDKSLLVFQAGTQPSRYRYLTIVRAYARQQLAGGTEYIAKQHAKFVADRASLAWKEWISISSSQWRRQYGYLIDDLRIALDWCFEHNQDRCLGRKILSASTPFWIQYSLHDTCRQYIAIALDEDPNGQATVREEMLMRAALGSALAWARGPIDENAQAWTRAGELARQIADKEIQLQSEYGLWLYHLRSGLYAKALESGQNMAQLAQEFGDRPALLTARRLIGTSRHFLGQQLPALTEIKSFLDCDTRDDQSGSHFRFGVDQRVAGWAFLVRVFWVIGDVNQARRAVQLAVEEAVALDHACSLCCVLAEGSCTLAALTGDFEQVAHIAQQIDQIASEHGLGLWRLYSAAFVFWARLQRNADSVMPQEIHHMLAILQANGFDPAYSLFLSDFAAALAEKGQYDEAEALISTLLATLPANQSSWNAAELLRVQAVIRYSHQTDSPQSLNIALQSAMNLAQEQGATSWVRKIEETMKGCLLG